MDILTGDMGFDDNEIVREAASIDEGLDHSNMLFGEGKKDSEEGRGLSMSSAVAHSSMDKHMDMDIDAPLRDDGFGGGVGEGLLC